MLFYLIDVRNQHDDVFMFMVIPAEQTKEVN